MSAVSAPAAQPETAAIAEVSARLFDVEQKLARRGGPAPTTQLDRQAVFLAALTGLCANTVFMNTRGSHELVIQTACVIADIAVEAGQAAQ